MVLAQRRKRHEHPLHPLGHQGCLDLQQHGNPTGQEGDANLLQPKPTQALPLSFVTAGRSITLRGPAAFLGARGLGPFCISRGLPQQNGETEPRPMQTCSAVNERCPALQMCPDGGSAGSSQAAE